MSPRRVAALILAAGRGERMNSGIPKVLHRAAGVPLIHHVLGAVRGAGIRDITVVLGPDGRALRSLIRLDGVRVVIQQRRLGTGHAVLEARRQLGRLDGSILILPADTPCIQSSTLQNFIRFHAKDASRATVLTAVLEDPTGYGRILRTRDRVTGILEELDLTHAERRIKEVNSGIYLFDAAELFERLGELGRNQRKKEYYLTDVVAAYAESGESVRAHRISDHRDILGVNTKRQLAVANRVLTERELERHSRAGVTILEPAQTFIEQGVRIGRDSVIHPFTWIERGVVIGRRCEIGPFAKIRTGSRIGNGAVIGSFVEVVRSKVGEKTCVKHLSYLGDARIGKKVNVGAGTVIANFDGRRKHQTVVRDRALLGCDTVLVAPVTVGTGARTGAGAVVCARHTVPAGRTVVGVPARVMKRSRKGR